MNYEPDADNLTTSPQWRRAVESTGHYFTGIASWTVRGSNVIGDMQGCVRCGLVLINDRRGVLLIAVPAQNLIRADRWVVSPQNLIPREVFSRHSRRARPKTASASSRDDNRRVEHQVLDSRAAQIDLIAVATSGLGWDLKSYTMSDLHHPISMA